MFEFLLLKRQIHHTQCHNYAQFGQRRKNLHFQRGDFVQTHFFIHFKWYAMLLTRKKPLKATHHKIQKTSTSTRKVPHVENCFYLKQITFYICK